MWNQTIVNNIYTEGFIRSRAHTHKLSCKNQEAIAFLECCLCYTLHSCLHSWTLALFILLNINGLCHFKHLILIINLYLLPVSLFLCFLLCSLQKLHVLLWIWSSLTWLNSMSICCMLTACKWNKHAVHERAQFTRRWKNVS